MLFDVSEFVALVETVALSELTTEDITKVDDRCSLGTL